jgi:hypothetical protein
MPRSQALYDWTARVTTAFPDLHAAHARSMAAWSFGLAHAGAASLSAVALFLADLLAQAFDTARQRPATLRPPAAPACSGGSPAPGPTGGWPWPSTPPPSATGSPS